MTLVIERGVPVPSINAPIRDAVQKMEVGDSVLIPGRTAQQVRDCIQRVKGDKYFEARTMTTGIRVWRME